VLQPDQSYAKQVHETCHAHQHWSINGGAALSPSDYDLVSWYGTVEGQSFSAAVTDWPWPYAISTEVNRLEDFAESCALYYTDPARLLDISQARYNWMHANLP